MTQAAQRLLPSALLALCPLAPAQAPADVLRFYEPYRQSEIRLLDTQSTVVHTWPTVLFRNGGIDLHADGTLVRGVKLGISNGLQRLMLDGTILWEYGTPTGLISHHDIEAMPNGNVLMIVEQRKTAAEAIARGRNPATIGEYILPDGIIEVQPTGPQSGVIVWAWSVWDHLIQDFDSSKANFGVVGDHPELVDINNPVRLNQGAEFTHMNGIDYDPIHDWVVMSSPLHNEIWIVDHSTTTAEAGAHSGGQRGKGGDLLYRWGNPAVYRAGPPSAQMLDFQHDPRFIPPGYPGAGNVTIFDNNLRAGVSAVREIVLPLDASDNFILTPGSAYGPTAPVWTYSEKGVFSQIMSSAERLPNGNTLVCSGRQGWLFEVTPAGQRVWEYFENVGAHSLFHAHHTQRSLWADREAISAAAGGAVQFDLQAGTPRAGDAYVLLGSASGNTPGFALSGVNVPLNADGYLFGVIGSLGSGIFASWAGTTDASGGATATYALPALPFLAGIRLDHAMLTIDPVSLTLSLASNAVPLSFLP